MKRKYFFSLGLLFCCLIAAGKTNAQPDSLWSRTFGVNTSYSCCSLVQTVDCELVIAGDKTPWFGNASTLLYKVSKGGDLLWSRYYRGEGNYFCYSMIKTSDEGFALAGRRITYEEGMPIENCFLMVTNSEGDSLWSRTYGGNDGAYNSCRAVMQTEDGGFALVGWFGGFGYPYVGILRTDQNGDSLWYRLCGDDIFTLFSAIQTSDGGFAAVGDDSEGHLRIVRMNSVGDILWSRNYESEFSSRCHAVVQTSDGGFALGGISGIHPCDFYLLRIDENGDSLWSRRFGGADNDVCESLIQMSDRGFILGGYSNSFNDISSDFWVVRTNSRGDSIWSRSFGGPDFDELVTLMQTNDRGFALLGNTYSFGMGNPDIWLVKTSREPASVPLESSESCPSAFILSEPYPNPFNNRVTLGFQVVSPIDVLLDAYDMSGRRVAVIQQGRFIPGRYSVSWNAAGISAGEYIIRLSDGCSEGLSKSVVLVK